MRRLVFAGTSGLFALSVLAVGARASADEAGAVRKAEGARPRIAPSGSAGSAGANGAANGASSPTPLPGADAGATTPDLCCPEDEATAHDEHGDAGATLPDTGANGALPGIGGGCGASSSAGAADASGSGDGLRIEIAFDAEGRPVFRIFGPAASPANANANAGSSAVGNAGAGASSARDASGPFIRFVPTGPGDAAPPPGGACFAGRPASSSPSSSSSSNGGRTSSAGGQSSNGGGSSSLGPIVALGRDLLDSLTRSGSPTGGSGGNLASGRASSGGSSIPAAGNASSLGSSAASAAGRNAGASSGASLGDTSGQRNAIAPPPATTGADGQPTTGQKVSEEDLEILARIIKAEAGSRAPFDGKVAVAACVLNRVAHKSFPNTIRGVVFQKWQFSAVNPGEKAKLYDGPIPSWAWAAANAAVAGWDPTEGATHYFNPFLVQPSWAKNLTKIKRIGNTRTTAHEFYKIPGTQMRPGTSATPPKGTSAP